MFGLFKNKNNEEKANCENDVFSQLDHCIVPDDYLTEINNRLNDECVLNDTISNSLDKLKSINVDQSFSTYTVDVLALSAIMDIIGKTSKKFNKYYNYDNGLQDQMETLNQKIIAKNKALYDKVTIDEERMITSILQTTLKNRNKEFSND